MTNAKSACPPGATVEQAGQVGEAFGTAYLHVYSTSPPRSRQPGTSVFREVRERVTAEAAARHYGLTFDRKGWAMCPFHQDKHPSMSFRAGRFRCWACGTSGDSIDFTGRLWELTPLEAVSRLNDDFCLGLLIDRRPTPAEQQAARRRREVAEAHQAFEAWRTTFIAKLNAAYRVGHQALNRLERPEDFSGLSERECIAVQLMPHIEDLADTLSYGPPEEQAQIFRERRRIAAWIEALLKNS